MPKHGAWWVGKSVDEKLIKPNVAIEGCSPSLLDDIYRTALGQPAENKKEEIDYDDECLKTSPVVYKQCRHEIYSPDIPDLSKIRVKLRESAQKRLSGGKAATSHILFT
jgi:hypothetical protein